MSKRRRWTLGLLLALVAGVAAIVWSILAPGGRMAVKVVFVGFTNSITTHTFSSGDVESVRVKNCHVPMAVLMITNTGSVTVKVFPEIRYDTRTNFSKFAPPLYAISARSLRPGEAGFFQALVLDRQRPWWTELAYCRYGLRMRLHDKLWNTGNSVAPGLMKRLAPSMEKHWVQSGWITNLDYSVLNPRKNGVHRVLAETKSTF